MKRRHWTEAELQHLRSDYADTPTKVLARRLNRPINTEPYQLLIEENKRLAKLATQRGARMQLMREWMDSNRGIGPPTEWWYFCEERPEAKKWFDADGVPIRA